MFIVFLANFNFQQNELYKTKLQILFRFKAILNKTLNLVKMQ
jgi:hypothetical protein